MVVPSSLKGLAPTTLLFLSLPHASAHVGSGAQCANCHNSARQAFALTGFHYAIGPSLIYQVAPGQKVPIGVNVFNGGSEYGLAVLDLEASGSLNPSNKLVFHPDPAWTKRSGYFSLGPKSSANTWTLQLDVPATTPADAYFVTIRAAGTGGGRWNDEESFRIEVSRPAPPSPQITHPSHHGTEFSCQVTTITGYFYSLQTRSDPSQPTWTTVANLKGDGSVKTLTDPNANLAQALYRVRVD